MNKILIIQTAFLGDVVLATALIEKLHAHYPQAQLDFLLRKGNESLLKEHPLLQQVLIWNKKEGKYKSLMKLLAQIRAEKYDLVVNVQRFGATGILTALSGAKETVGFDKNPFSRFFTRRHRHDVTSGTHEVERNQLLIQSITDATPAKPKLYPSQADFAKVEELKGEKFICMAPTSVWFTKQYPLEQWVTLINSIDPKYKVYLLGSPADKAHCDEIIGKSTNSSVENLCGQLSLLQSAALMRDAVLNYVNDSGPMHLASALNAPTCAIYCSTVPSFGFGPLADFANVVEREEPLYCRPCGLHGYKACPEGHFKCARDIRNEQLLEVLQLAEIV
ncbi:glycosyltransferase family 9 protein [Pontibacter cellulosilyticus]|uniref:Glycosyltransferase family 9 protein n=1 Tax=Pontibacter cellulosilyticus TaxID=1720253 RepID=A0A923N9W7_9BACT|nr:glycosyltransferase family 9 protein [Pontibacter cellulosilyticus]MBC5993095.1 glycosyltransferase family 9 protein [Pontibacter cellulosilyticus]